MMSQKAYLLGRLARAMRAYNRSRITGAAFDCILMRISARAAQIEHAEADAWIASYRLRCAS